MFIAETIPADCPPSSRESRLRKGVRLMVLHPLGPGLQLQVDLEVDVDVGTVLRDNQRGNPPAG